MFRYLLSFFLFSGGSHIDQTGISDYNVKKKKKKKKKMYNMHVYTHFFPDHSSFFSYLLTSCPCKFSLYIFVVSDGLM